MSEDEKILRRVEKILIACAGSSMPAFVQLYFLDIANLMQQATGLLALGIVIRLSLNMLFGCVWAFMLNPETEDKKKIFLLGLSGPGAILYLMQAFHTSTYTEEPPKLPRIEQVNQVQITIPQDDEKTININD